MLSEMSPSPDKDLEAFGQIVAAHEAAVRAFIAVRLDDPFEAHDLAQEVFLLLWRKLGKMDLNQPLRPWLLGVAANLVRKHRRKGRATPVGGPDAVLELLDQRVAGGEAFDGPVFAALEHCLAQLGEGARQLIEWRYAEGLGLREIRERTGGKHSALSMKLHRLRALLLECIRAQVKEAAS